MISITVLFCFVFFAKRDDRGHHVYGKRETSDSSREFLKVENEQIKTAQNNSYG